MLNARLIHREVCLLLSEAFDNLHSTIAQYNRIMPVWQQVETPAGLKTAVTIPQTNKVPIYILYYSSIDKIFVWSPMEGGLSVTKKKNFLINRTQYPFVYLTNVCIT